MWIITREGTAKDVVASKFREQLTDGTVRLPTPPELRRIPSRLSDDYQEEIPGFTNPWKWSARWGFEIVKVDLEGTDG